MPVSAAQGRSNVKREIDRGEEEIGGCLSRTDTRLLYTAIASKILSNLSCATIDMPRGECGRFISRTLRCECISRPISAALQLVRTGSGYVLETPSIRLRRVEQSSTAVNADAWS